MSAYSIFDLFKFSNELFDSWMEWLQEDTIFFPLSTFDQLLKQPAGGTNNEMTHTKKNYPKFLFFHNHVYLSGCHFEENTKCNSFLQISQTVSTRQFNFCFITSGIARVCDLALLAIPLTWYNIGTILQSIAILFSVGILQYEWYLIFWKKKQINHKWIKKEMI